MKVFESAKWIWLHNENREDEYVEFRFPLVYNGEKSVKIRLSCDGDYTLFVGGRYGASNQYGDYEHYKIYDEIDITNTLKKGENTLDILVWHFGRNSQRYLLAKAGLIFEIEKDGEIVLCSNESIPCRLSSAYRNGYKKLVTRQLGFSFYYDATKEDQGEFVSPVIVEKNCTFYPRQTDRLTVGKRMNGNILKSEGNYYLVDLGQEQVGLATLSFASQTEQKILVAWGEDLQNGHVRRIIDDRDFSFEYFAKKGKNEYTNYMLRLGGRYLEVYAENPIDVEYIGVYPQAHHVAEKPACLQDPLDQKIYDVCVHTLKMCMMEHYVDCPWREQCLYAFDSRNQILCGYYAFENGNLDYVRSNLALMNQDRYPSGMLSICFPCGADLTIPSFTLYYTLEVKEYLEYSKDYAFAREVAPRIFTYMNLFLSNRVENGLVSRFAGANNWNFYDWTKYADGEKEIVPDAQVNMLTVMALRSLKRICELGGVEYPYGDIDGEIAKATYQAFYDQEEKAFSVTQGGKEFTELVNAFAIVFDIVQGDEAYALGQRLANGEFMSCTLSMKCFTYDALLKLDFAKWQGHVLDEIRKTYKMMLDHGATSFWETKDGAIAFDNAGSLCHGWTAIPIYYFHKFGMVK